MARDGRTEYLTTKDAADTLGYTVQHTRLLIRQGRLAATKLGRDWLLPRESVAEYRVAQAANGRPDPDVPSEGKPRALMDTPSPAHSTGGAHGRSA
ncbi:MAG: helix-turn-helix domain-containing protein [Armatimonadetes bacterium]|nr:helix-turn-helix domain-containing protein [Armatimonadota bacterium]